MDAAITDMNGGNREAERSERSDPHETREVSVEGVGGEFGRLNIKAVKTCEMTAAQV